MAPVRAVWCYTTSNTTSNTSIEGEEEIENEENGGERIQLGADEEYPCVYRGNDSDSDYRPVSGLNRNINMNGNINMGMGLCDGMGEDITDARNGSGSGTGSNSGCGSDSVPGLIRPIELNDFCKYGVQHLYMKCRFVQQ